MTLSNQEISAIEEVFERIGEHISHIDTDNLEKDEVLELFKEHADSGEINSLEEVTVFSVSKDEAVSYVTEYDSVCGVDASSTRPEMYDGIAIDVAHAVARGSNVPRDLEETSTIVAAISTGGRDVDIDNSITDINNIQREIIEVESDSSDARDEVEKRGKTMAEGLHLEKIAGKVDCLIRDGPIYPSILLGGLIFAKEKAQVGRDFTDAPNKNLDDDIIDKYIYAIDNQKEVGDFIGFVKTIGSRELISSIKSGLDEDEIDEFIWLRDDNFLTTLLKTDDFNQITFTNWFEKGMTEREGVPVERMKGFNTEEEPEKYRRCFFYLREPVNGYVYRVEAPKMMVDTQKKRDKIRCFVLKEVARSADIPQCVKMADEDARITAGNSKEFMRKFEKVINDEFKRTKGYNRDGRHEDITYEGDKQ